MLETYQNMPSPITFKSDDSVVYFLQFSRVFQFNLNTTTMPGSKSGNEKGAGGRRGSRMSRGSRVSQKKPNWSNSAFVQFLVSTYSFVD